MNRIFDYLGHPILITDSGLSEPEYPADSAIVGSLIGHSPELYGAVGDGVIDDTLAFQRAVDTKYVLCNSDKVYRISQPIRIKKNTVINLNGSTILSRDKHVFYNFEEGDSYSGYNGNGNILIYNGTIIGGCVSFIHGYEIKLSNIRFKNVLNDHFVEIDACDGYTIENCSFVGMQNLSSSVLEYINIDTNASYPAFPHNKAGQNDSAFYDMTTNKNIIIKDNYFATGSDDFGYGFNAIGVHSRNVDSTYSDSVTIKNNIIRGFTGCGIRVNAMKDAYVADNDIRVEGDGIRIGDVADCLGVTIKGNYIDAGSGNSISLTSGQYTDLTVAYNVDKGMNDIN